MAQITLNSSGVASNGSLLLQSNGTTTAVTIDASQNVGIGVTPSAWVSSTALQVGPSGSVAGNSSLPLIISANAYGTTAGFVAKYITSNYATIYLQYQGEHRWNTAPSGTAGNTISANQAMTLDASGNVGVGVTNPSQRLDLQNGSSDVSIRFRSPTNSGYISYGTDNSLQFLTSSNERARIDSSGNLLVGFNSGATFHVIKKAVSTDGSVVLQVTHDGAGPATSFYAVANSASFNAANTAITVGRTATSRSINAAGTINASGADYAEYMTKAGDFAVAKGDVVGINAEGKLTNVFADAVSFAVKSTDPSYVGGDVWGNEDAIGKRPEPDAPQAEKDAFEAALEAARQTVDRIAFAGQVPVNVTGATAGQYIVPVNNNGAIKGEAVNEADMTLANYMKAVGKVIAIEQDGRAKIIVKVA